MQMPQQNIRTPHGDAQESQQTLCKGIQSRAFRQARLLGRRTRGRRLIITLIIVSFIYIFEYIAFIKLNSLISIYLIHLLNFIQNNIQNKTVYMEEDKKVEGLPSSIIFNELKQIYAALPKEQTTLQSKLNDIFLKDYGEDQREIINQLIQVWDQSTDVQTLMFDQFTNNVAFYNYYRNVTILSARVYHVVLKFYTDIRVKNIKEIQGKDLEGFRKILEADELNFSYNRHFWDKRYIQNATINYSQYSFTTHQEPKQIYQNKFMLSTHNWIRASQIDLLKVLQTFLLDTGFISLQKSNQLVQNEFMNSLERIAKEQQKKKYINNLRFEQYQNIKRLSNNSYQYEGQKQEIIAKLHKVLPNYQFYTGLKVEKQTNLQELHDKFQNQSFLDEKNDVYFLHMFPNHYGYVVKSKAVPLHYVQKELIIRDQVACFNFFYSTLFYLEYLGLGINIQNFSLSIKESWKLQKTILMSNFNHSKIMRFLTSLSILGFRKIALNLIDLLDEETKEGKLLQKQRFAFQNNWETYGNFKGQPRKSAKVMCFLQIQQFPRSNSFIDFSSKNAPTSPT